MVLAQRFRFLFLDLAPFVEKQEWVNFLTFNWKKKFNLQNQLLLPFSSV